MSATLEELEGAVLANRYRIEHFLAEGGMGAVYAATQLDLGRRVAIKVLRAAREIDGDALARFHREARTAARVGHANIVQVFDFRAKRGEPPFLVMEHLEGRSLGAILEDDGVLGVRRVAVIATQLLSALAAAHRAGIVHRDVKPDNVFVTQVPGLGEFVKLIDFGVAKLASERLLTGVGRTVGTPMFMAPEQANGEDADARADVFGVGATMYQALTGACPYEGEGNRLMRAVCRGHWVPIRDRRPTLDPTMMAIIERALARNPADRFASADEMAQALLPFTAKPLSDPDSPSFFDTSRSEELATTVDRLTHALSASPPTGPASSWGALRAAAAVGALVALASTAGLALALPRMRASAPAASSCIRSAQCQGDGVCGAEGRCVARKGCRSNAECTQTEGEAAICRSDTGACARLASPECRVLADRAALEDDATIWIGTMFPANDPDLVLEENAAELARRDFMTMTGGVPFPDPAQRRRPLAIVACDDSAEPARAAHHLVDDVGVPAVIGFASSKEAVDLATNLFVPRRVMTVAAPNRSAMIDDVAQPPNGPRFLWRTTAGASRYAEPMAALAASVERRRVALVRGSGDVGLSFSDAVFRALHRRGALGDSPLDNFRELVLDDSRSLPSMRDELLAYRPGVILYAALSGKRIAPLTASLEEAWRENEARPYQVRSAAWEDGDLLSFVPRGAEQRSRYLSVHAPLNTTQNAQLVLHYNETFPGKITMSWSPAATYDAMYLLAYAAGATQGRITGEKLARALEGVTSGGTPIDVGPTRIVEAFGLLGRGAPIALHGAETRLEFDSESGEPKTDFVFLCPRPRDEGSGFDEVESGLSFDAATRTLRGAIRCPG
jgi:serine/threonine protein kinase/ABC-type branched-subunit amino acid transport system substrate-binding protein